MATFQLVLLALCLRTTDAFGFNSVVALVVADGVTTFPGAVSRRDFRRSGAHKTGVTYARCDLPPQRFALTQVGK
jgi:hypothetical protein